MPKWASKRDGLHIRRQKPSAEADHPQEEQQKGDHTIWQGEEVIADITAKREAAADQ